MRWDASGPYIAWEDLGCEGWHPRSFDTLRAAVEHKGYSSAYAVTRVVEYDIIERMTEDTDG